MEVDSLQVEAVSLEADNQLQMKSVNKYPTNSVVHQCDVEHDSDLSDDDCDNYR